MKTQQVTKRTTYDYHIAADRESEKIEDYFHKLKAAGIRARTLGSGVLSLCYACIGGGDGLIAIENSSWDVAAGLVFAAELGMEFKQLNGIAQLQKEPLRALSEQEKRELPRLVKATGGRVDMMQRAKALLAVANGKPLT